MNKEENVISWHTQLQCRAARKANTREWMDGKWKEEEEDEGIWFDNNEGLISWSSIVDWGAR